MGLCPCSRFASAASSARVDRYVRIAVAVVIHAVGAVAHELAHADAVDAPRLAYRALQRLAHGESVDHVLQFDASASLIPGTEGVEELFEHCLPAAKELDIIHE